MGLLIDTNILIACEKGVLDLDRMIAEHDDDSVFLSVISASELLHGVHRAAEESVRTRRLAFVETLLKGMEVLEIDLAVARIHAELWSDLSERGQMIGPHDLWLAASALANDCTLVTRNIREFNRISGLKVETW
jgi:predicted nucleic acid-binding protein